MPWNVPRKYYDLFPLATIELPPCLENDLDDIPPAGIRMAHPEPDHIPMLKSGRWKEAVQGYLAAIAYTDMNIGRRLAAFEKSAYRDNTIICLWGDHGWHLGEKHHWRKFTLWEEATRAPLIWIVPGLTKPGSVSPRTVDFMSIYPTLTDLCGIPTPAHVEGRSIRPLLVNADAPWTHPAMAMEREVDYSRTFPTEATPAQMARTILADLDLEGTHRVSGGRDGKPLVIDRQHAWTPRRITFHPETGKLLVQREVFRGPAFLERMHRRRGYQQVDAWNVAWAVSVDLAMVAAIFWSLSGLWLWWELRSTRGWGALAAGAGLLSFSLFLLWL